ncbi:MAG: DUF1801 domain-containing protein [Chloroflexi bacterium]|nr:DUF1801 domain-containing protein [Chloroflexota bacterium]
MTLQKANPKNIDEYIASFPQDVQAILKELRTTIKKAAPDAQETIKYQIPTFTLYGNLISFAAYKNHIGLYPAPRAVKGFKKELSAYKGTPSSVHFPYDQLLPHDLITRIVKFRVREFLKRAEAKAKKK